MNHKTVTVDVREDIRNGREPFAKIMAAAAGLAPNERLLLIAPFEPIPLFAVLAKQGFQYESRSVGSGDWEVLFTRATTPSASQAPAPGREDRHGDGFTSDPAEVVELDARGLEPPQPMVKILEAVSALRPCAELRARTDRRPMHLYPHLEERGFIAETKNQPDGSYLTQIRHG